MLAKELGTCSGSDLYFQTPTETARSLLYYMTSCGYYYTGYDYHIKREDYGSFLLFCVCNGRLSVRSENTTVVAEAGQVGFLNCHLPHEYYTIGSAEFVWLHMDGANTARFYDHIVKQYDSFVFDSPCFNSMKERIFKMIYACRNEQMLTEVQISEKLYAILLSCLGGSFSKTQEKTCDDERIESAIQYIRKHYGDNISVETLSQYVNMSKYHFSRLFKKHYGYSPGEFLLMTRMNQAKYLLKTTELPVKVIAQTVGYQNVTSFVHAFINRVGISPSRFRQYPI